MEVRLQQAARQVVARRGMQGAWQPGPGRKVIKKQFSKAGRPKQCAVPAILPASSELVPASSEIGAYQLRALQKCTTKACRQSRTDMNPEQKDNLCRQLEVIFR